MDIERFDNRSFTRAAHACWECPCPGKSTRCDARSSRLERVDENDAGLYVEPLEVGRFTLREALLAPNALQNGEGLSCPPIGRLLASRATIAPTRPQSPRWGVEYRTPSPLRCAKRWAPQAMRALRLMLTIQKQVCKADANRRSRCSNAIHRRSHPWDPRARKYSLGLTAPLRDFLTQAVGLEFSRFPTSVDTHIEFMLFACLCHSVLTCQVFHLGIAFVFGLRHRGASSCTLSGR